MPSMQGTKVEVSYIQGIVPSVVAVAVSTILRRITDAMPLYHR